MRRRNRGPCHTTRMCRSSPSFRKEGFGEDVRRALCKGSVCKGLATPQPCGLLCDAFPLRSPRGPLQTISGFELRSSRALTIENKI